MFSLNLKKSAFVTNISLNSDNKSAYFIVTDELPVEAAITTNFLTKMDQLFDAVNGRFT